MLKPNASILLLISCAICLNAYGRNRFQGINTVVTVVTGTAAVQAFVNGAKFGEMQLDDYEELKLYKVRPPELYNSALYSIHFSINNDALPQPSWVLSKHHSANCFARVTVNGSRTIIVPEIIRNYKGQDIQLNFITDKFPSGSKIKVEILNDDRSAFKSWWDINRSRTSLKTEAGNHTIYIGIEGGALNDTKLSDTGIGTGSDALDLIAYMEFKVPRTFKNCWNATGRLEDSQHQKVGELQLIKYYSFKKGSRRKKRI